jgi:hypothetical protein
LESGEPALRRTEPMILAPRFEGSPAEAGHCRDPPNDCLGSVRTLGGVRAGVDVCIGPYSFLVGVEGVCEPGIMSARAGPGRSSRTNGLTHQDRQEVARTWATVAD